MSDAFDPLCMIDISEGRLTSLPQDLSQAFAASAGRPLVMHFHGGLVSGEAARTAAKQGAPFYAQAGAHAIYPIWHTGAFEVLATDWKRIAGETLFRMLVDRVAGWAHAQIQNVFGGGRSGVVSRDLPAVDEAVMRASGEGEGDFPAHFIGEVDLTGLAGQELEPNDFELRAIESGLRQDGEFAAAWDAVLRGAGKPVEEGARDLAGVPEQPPAATVADEAVLDALREDADTRGLGLGAAKLTAGIIVKVLGRFARGTDHGLHATVTEEVLRAVYAAKAGAAVWESIKGYTSAAFDSDSMSAGSLMVEELGKLPEGQRVILVGHSAGAIFICELLERLAPTGRQVEVILLAPAARCQLFEEALAINPNVLASSGGHPAFRMFSMSDAYETKDFLVRGVPGLGDLTWFYPRSLLYLVSGLFEDVPDADVLGLQRSHSAATWYSDRPQVKAVRDWFGQPRDRVSWSVTGDGTLPRLRTNSTTHGGFGTPGGGNTTMESVAQIVASGWT